ncbi:MAG: DUF2800 domain-containing protein [Hyphomicrobiales bacterium]
MAAHSNVVGGSTAARVINCPGSVLHNRKFKNEETSYAAEGTALHEAVAFILDGNTENDRDVIGMVFHDHVITEELFEEALAPSLAFFDTLDEEYGGLEFETEQRVKFRGIEDAFGTVDIIGKGKIDRTLVFDWKYGAGHPVSAKENSQLMFYGFAAMCTEVTADMFKHHPGHEVELVIAQPRLIAGPNYSRWVTNVNALKAFARRLTKAVEVALTDDMDHPFKIGDHCKFCPGMATCPEHVGYADEAMIHREQREMAEDMGTYLDMIKPLQNWIKAVQHTAQDLAEGGHKIEGYKLVNKKVTSKWTDPEETRKFFAARRGIKVPDYTVTKVVGITEARKLAKKHGWDIDPLITSGSSGVELAPEKDKREEVVVHARALENLTKYI